MNYYRQLIQRPPDLIYPPTALRIILNKLIDCFDEQRLYSSATRDDIEDLVERFVGAHAESSSPETSLQIVRAPDYWIQHPLMNFLAWRNGAVFHAASDNPAEEEFFLWIDETTSVQWGYPMHSGWFVSLEEEANYQKMIRLQLLNMEILDRINVFPKSDKLNEEDSDDDDHS